MNVRHREHGFFSIFFIIIIATVAVILLYKFRDKLQTSQNTAPQTKSLIPEERLTELEALAKTPTMFVAKNKNGDIVIGDLNSKEVTTIVHNKVMQYGESPELIKVSPNKKYLTYVILSPSGAQEYNKANFSGSLDNWIGKTDDWKLHLVDISDINKSKD